MSRTVVMIRVRVSMAPPCESPALDCPHLTSCSLVGGTVSGNVRRELDLKAFLYKEAFPRIPNTRR